MIILEVSRIGKRHTSSAYVADGDCPRQPAAQNQVLTESVTVLRAASVLCTASLACVAVSSRDRISSAQASW